MNIRRHRGSRRAGNVLVLSVFMMIMMFAVLAFSVDLGYLYVARSQLQNSADATALASAWDLIDEDALSGAANPWTRIELLRTTADQYAGLNTVGGLAPALAVEDVEVGYLANPSDPEGVMSFDDPAQFNAVRVRVRRTENQNGQVPMFFARAVGVDESGVQAEATAAFLNNLSGFTTPSSGENLGILPIALDKETWDEVLEGIGNDDFTCTWDEENDTWVITEQPDGIPEANLFPQDIGSPGNRGTIDIGSNNNSTNDIARQILDGITPEDLAYHGGSLEFDANGEMFLNGDTGISAGVKDELASIKGLPRTIPIFSQVSGNGNNAQYTIVQFAGVRVLDVKLTGSVQSKRVIIQPACVTSEGIIPPTDDTQKSNFVYSPVWLVR